MFKSYVTTAWRNLITDKTYSALNILGLSIGMAVALIIGLWVYYQYSFDRFLPGYERAYTIRDRLNRNGEIQVIPATAQPLAAVLKKEVPEIQYVALGRWNNNHGLVVGDKKIYDMGLRMGEDFLKIFPFPFVEGNANTALSDPHSIVLTRSTAVALFGKEDPMGKMIRVDNEDNVIVTGVLEDLPRNTSFPFRFLQPFSYEQLHSDFVKNSATNWERIAFITYVSLRPGVSEAQVAPKLAALLLRSASRR